MVEKLGGDSLIKVVSLFSGIGGFEIGIMDALESVNISMSSEIDKYAAEAYEMYFNHKPEGDITKIDSKDIPNHDVLVAGFPCQPFSISGNRKGFEDTRGTLFFEVARILKDKEPKVFIAENVKGLISHDKPKGSKGYPSLFNKQYDGKKKGIGNTLKVIEETLAELNYDVYWDVLNTKNHGLPQNRERIFIIGFRKDLSISQFNFPIGKDYDIRLKHILENVVDEKYYLPDEKVKKLIEQIKEKNQDISYCIDANYHKGTTPEQFLKKSRRQLVATQEKQICEQRTDEGLRFFKDDVCGTIRTIDSGGDKRVIERQEAPAPELVGGIGEINYGKQYRQGNRVYDADKTAMCLLSQPVGNAGGNSYLYAVKVGCQCSQPAKPGAMMVGEQYRIRKLTPKECWRLQGFSDEYHDLVATKISDTQRYKQAGNAVSTVVIRDVFIEIAKVLGWKFKHIT